MEDLRRQRAGGIAQGEVQLFVYLSQHDKIIAIRYMGKDLGGAFALPNVIATAVRWGRPESTLGGKFLRSFGVLL